MGQFVAIRMIILNSDENSADFKDWMTTSGGFLDKIGVAFQGKGGLLRIIFLEGNKVAQQSWDESDTRADSTAAGANADFAWITFWTSKEDNTTAWSDSSRPQGWDADWSAFKSKCHPKFSEPTDSHPSRPLHGPPYDYRGAPGYRFYDNQTGRSITHHGKGAGCLVEGFEVIYDKSSWS